MDTWWIQGIPLVCLCLGYLRDPRATQGIWWLCQESNDYFRDPRVMVRGLPQELDDYLKASRSTPWVWGVTQGYKFEAKVLMERRELQGSERNLKGTNTIVQTLKFKILKGRREGLWHHSKLTYFCLIVTYLPYVDQVCCSPAIAGNGEVAGLGVQGE